MVNGRLDSLYRIGIEICTINFQPTMIYSDEATIKVLCVYS